MDLAERVASNKMWGAGTQPFTEKFTQKVLSTHLNHLKQAKPLNRFPIMIAGKDDFNPDQRLTHLGYKKNFLGTLFGIKIYSEYLFV